MSQRDPAMMSIMEWSNLMAAIKTVIERYGLDAVEDALKLLRISKGAV